MICRHKLHQFTVANTRFSVPLTRRGKTKFATVKWYNLCLQIIDTPGLAPRMNVLFWGPGDYSAIWSIPLTNVKWHSDPWPTVTSQAIRLSTNFITFIPSLTFTDYEWFPWIICNGCGMPAGNAYPSGHLVPFPIMGLACAPIVETRFLELAMSLLDFSPRIPLGTFSILHNHKRVIP